MKKTVIFTVLALFLALATTAICVYNSDWYFNKKVQKTALQNVKLGDVTYNYYPRYEDGILKARFEFINLDDETFSYVKSFNKDNEPLFSKEYLDKDNFVIASIKLTGGNFSKNGDIHTAQSQTKITKKEFNKIVADRDAYKTGLIKPYKQLMKDIWGDLY